MSRRSILVLVPIALMAPPRVARAQNPLALPEAVLDRRAGKHALYTSDGFMLVNLRGGPPEVFPIGGRSTDKERTIRGRVVGRDGAPVADAIVFADRGLGVRRDTLMALAATTTDATGAFPLHDAPADECYAIALVDDDWSELVRVGDGPVELRLRGHGALSAKLTYDGKPAVFDIHIGTRDRRIGLRYTTARDGTLTIPSLPPGTYTATLELARGLDGASQSVRRELVIVDGKTARLALELARASTVVLRARPVPSTKPKGLTYWLFSGSAPRDGADARARSKRETPPSLTVGAGAALAPVELADIASGAYWACATYFDPATMVVRDTPFGCTEVTVRANESVPEVVIVLGP